MVTVSRVDWLGPVLRIVNGLSNNRHGYDSGRPIIPKGSGLSLFVVSTRQTEIPARRQHREGPPPLRAAIAFCRRDGDLVCRQPQACSSFLSTHGNPSNS